MGNIIEVDRLSKAFGKTDVLRALAFSVSAKEKEVVSVIGPSGSGKTTLLRCLAMLDSPSDGEIRLRGVPVTKVHALAAFDFLHDAIAARNEISWIDHTDGAGTIRYASQPGLARDGNGPGHQGDQPCNSRSHAQRETNVAPPNGMRGSISQRRIALR